jgi:hypothetical protein
MPHVTSEHPRSTRVQRLFSNCKEVIGALFRLGGFADKERKEPGKTASEQLVRHNSGPPGIQSATEMPRTLRTTVSAGALMCLSPSFKLKALQIQC